MAIYNQYLKGMLTACQEFVDEAAASLRAIQPSSTNDLLRELAKPAHLVLSPEPS